MVNSIYNKTKMVRKNRLDNRRKIGKERTDTTRLLQPDSYIEYSKPKRLSLKNIPGKDFPEWHRYRTVKTPVSIDYYRVRNEVIKSFFDLKTGGLPKELTKKVWKALFTNRDIPVKRPRERLPKLEYYKRWLDYFVDDKGNRTARAVRTIIRTGIYDKLALEMYRWFKDKMIKNSKNAKKSTKPKSDPGETTKNKKQGVRKK